MVRNKMMEDLPELGRQGVCPMMQGTGVHPDDRQGRKEEGGGGGGGGRWSCPSHWSGQVQGGEEREVEGARLVSTFTLSVG